MYIPELDKTNNYPVLGMRYNPVSYSGVTNLVLPTSHSLMLIYLLRFCIKRVLPGIMVFNSDISKCIKFTV